VIGRARQRDLLDPRPLRQAELRWPAAGIARGKGVEAVGVEVVGTSRTRSGLVKVTSAILATGMPCADRSTICARRQVTTEPVPRRTIRSSRLPSSSLIGRTCTRCTISHLLRGVRIRRDDGSNLKIDRHPYVRGYGATVRSRGTRT
jgi:hypothetical protein